MAIFKDNKKFKISKATLAFDGEEYFPEEFM